MQSRGEAFISQMLQISSCWHLFDLLARRRAGCATDQTNEEEPPSKLGFYKAIPASFSTATGTQDVVLPRLETLVRPALQAALDAYLCIRGS